MRVIHEDGRTGTAGFCSGHGTVSVRWDTGGTTWLHCRPLRPLGPIEDELLRADPGYSMAAQLRAESFDLWVGAGGLTGSWYGRSLSEAIEAARWLEDPDGNAAELARAREMGAIR
jgi:hypothetical protein